MRRTMDKLKRVNLPNGYRRHAINSAVAVDGFKGEDLGGHLRGALGDGEPLDLMHDALVGQIGRLELGARRSPARVIELHL